MYQDSQPHGQDRPAPDRTMTGLNHPYTVMIVDDESVSIMILEKLLEREGFTTFSTGEGTRVQELVRKRHPDLILLDVNLPEIRGPQICRQLKSHPATADIPVLFISVDSGTATKIECFEAGGQDYITKPYEALEVIARIRTHLRLAMAQQEVTRLLTRTIQDIAQAQQALAPPPPVQMPHAQFAVRCRQLSQAGGDFYDVYTISDYVHDYIVADVCGHDIGIALVTSALKALFKQNCSPLFTPGEALHTINRVIPAVLRQGQYVALTWIRINRRTHRATIINAGQPPVLFLPAEGDGRAMELTGDLIGLFDHISFDQQEIDVRPHDRFVLYSDGLVETDVHAAATRRQGIGHLLQTCREHRFLPLDRFIAQVDETMTQDRVPTDDIVIMGIEI